MTDLKGFKIRFIGAADLPEYRGKVSCIVTKAENPEDNLLWIQTESSCCMKEYQRFCQKVSAKTMTVEDLRKVLDKMDDSDFVFTNFGQNNVSVYDYTITKNHERPNILRLIHTMTNCKIEK